MFFTSRCHIRRFREEDLDAFTAYRNDASWMQYQGFKGLSREQYRRALLAEASLETGVQLAVAERSCGRLLGDLYLRQTGRCCWIGYTLAPEHARRGYAGEAVAGALRWLKETAACETVRAAVLPENAPSVALLGKLGFTYRYFDPQSGENIYSIDLAALPCDFR